ncbi:UNVERIFIED_ORG: alpha-1,2-fucosyltransferase [Shinella sp. XGS7]|nr:alpha-1,2-fucosyltransferase [Shinella sp. XGS7]
MSKKKFISMMGMPVTEQLGSQMWHFAALSYIAHRTDHRVVFFQEHAQTGRGLRLHQNFDNLPFELISIADLGEGDQVYSIFPLNKQVAVESAVYQLNPGMNYDFQGLFSSYKYWWPWREQVRAMYQFRAPVLEQARAVVERARKPGRALVSLHVRRTDYLNGFFVNVNMDYFKAAFAQFEGQAVSYLVFSDDLPWCKEAFADLPHVEFAEGNEAIVDMCAMSLCDHNITANSSFSFWGAFLNANPGKRMVAPARTLKSDLMIPHLNYCWLPDDFILVDAGNV